MTCDFPNLNWARLRIFVDGSADVFDMDGRTITFPNEDEARAHLWDDEYTEFSSLDGDDERELGVPATSIVPPVRVSDDDLLPQMYVKVI